jgi:hypothetical protein
MNLRSDAHFLSINGRIGSERNSLELLKQALPSQEVEALFWLYGEYPVVATKHHHMLPGLSYIEGFYK